MNDHIPPAVPGAGRQRLENRRPAERISFLYNNMQCSALVGLRIKGLRPDGALLCEIGDVFIDVGSKIGSDLDAAAQTGALLLSLGLQHGLDIGACQRSLPRHPDGRPTDIVGAAIDAIVMTYGGSQ